MVSPGTSGFTHTANCSIAIPSIRPPIAPTAMVGINKPAGTYGVKIHREVRGEFKSIFHE